MTDTPSPAPRDDELPETLERLIKLTLTLSDQVEEQTRAINKGTTLANEARHAATKAQEQTDPEHYGELIGQTVDGRIADSLNRLNKAAGALLSGAERSNASFQETTTAHSNTLRLIADLREKQRQDRRWLPWVGLGGVVLALVLTITLPRFLASNPTTCALIGATWTATSTGVNACVFYGE
ncbi:hypothetical protein [Sulfitobacter dubius]|uniref:Uncharacterized protein n=1 Tax=Sulfitobacter dubius TaxID=218673 RepID=A0ABY3ZRJ4_9RHOB|nr:hypothetical protein [Sulfitobacter dubius]UOA17230.1 hypothetical protein DSM109990_04129 [Sulfitobacter dubius]